ncbi:MAG: serine/threonine protein kinase [Sandaracinaceae bacterium]|nr:serine/threonine protein kinase [Sandaracinaceae bacterium]
MRRMQESDTYLLDRGGTILLGRYRVEELIGAGGMGSVWLAEQLALRQTVVVKFHETWSRAEDPERALERFVREAKLLAAVRHRNVISLFEVGSNEGEPFLIMERLHGHALAWRMRDGRPMPFDESLEIAIEIAKGLEAVHAAGVHHRDVKPENIFLHRDDGVIVPKLLDFGLAGSAKVSRLTDSGHTVGTPGYMPPEQAYGLDHIDHRVDLYALGVTLYEMLSGQLPSIGDTNEELVHYVVHHDPIPLSDHRPDLAGPIEDTIMRVLDRDREVRPADARALRRQLEDLRET